MPTTSEILEVLRRGVAQRLAAREAQATVRATHTVDTIERRIDKRVAHVRRVIRRGDFSDPAFTPR